MVIEERHCDISDGNSPCKNPISSYKIDGQINSKNYIFTLLSDKSIKIEPYYLKYGPKHIGLVTTTKPYEQ